jgi:hypothetical protein
MQACHRPYACYRRLVAVSYWFGAREMKEDRAAAPLRPTAEIERNIGIRTKRKISTTCAVRVCPQVESETSFHHSLWTIRLNPSSGEGGVK